MKRLPRTFAALAGSVALLGFAASIVPSQAQQTQQVAPQTAKPAPSVDLSDKTLHDFAKASIALDAVVKKWSPQLQKAKPGDSQKLRTEANKEMMQAVTSSGIDIQTFNQVYKVAQTSPNVAKKIQTYRTQLQ